MLHLPESGFDLSRRPQCVGNLQHSEVEGEGHSLDDRNESLGADQIFMSGPDVVRAVTGPSSSDMILSGLGDSGVGSCFKFGPGFYVKKEKYEQSDTRRKQSKNVLGIKDLPLRRRSISVSESQKPLARRRIRAFSSV